MSKPPIATDAATLKILDLGTQVAGPFAATILGDHNAEVIKIEQPISGDPIRLEGMSARWQVEGRNKHSITLNLRVAEGQELLKKLVGWADILVENFRPGTMDRWNLGYATLSKVNPKLVYVSVSGFGQTGPYANRSGYDYIGSAFGGLTAVSGYKDRAPLVPGLFMVDHMSGLFAAIGALEAVRRRDAPGGTGRGEYIDGSLYESVMRIAGANIAEYSLSGNIPTPVGGMPVDQNPEPPVTYTYQTRDGRWLSLGPFMPAQLEQLRKLVNEPALNDPCFDDNHGRSQNANHWYQIINAWVGAHNFDELWQLLGRTEIPASPVNQIPDLIDEPHIKARNSIISIKNSEGQTLSMPEVTPKLKNQPGKVKWSGETLGASNTHVYSGLLGLSREDIEQLKQQGII